MNFANYTHMLQRALDCVAVTAQGHAVSLQDGLDGALSLLRQAKQSGRTLFFFGNGASASMASHFATDFSKNGGIRSLAFNDPSLLTCYGNDFCYEEVFSRPLKLLAKAGDVALAISSSGRSPNILEATRTAASSGCRVISFSGLAAEPPLAKLGDVNFYVPAGQGQYGIVETAHAFLLHYLVDVMCVEGRPAKNG